MEKNNEIVAKQIQIRKWVLAYAVLLSIENTESYALSLAQSGVEFKSIAGNSGDILLSVLMKDNDAIPDSSNILFSQNISTKPGLKRVAITTKVPFLSSLLNELVSKQITVEHIYDY